MSCERVRAEGPSRDMDPRDSSALDYLLLLWPASFCELIALEILIGMQWKGVYPLAKVQALLKCGLSLVLLS